jgi:RNA polymerase sigma-70 factor, ECF subfamily
LSIDETDEQLFAAYVAGRAPAFDRLYARHRGGVYRYLLRHVRDRAIADELHQDVWMRVIKSRDGFGADARFATWAYAIARNRLIDHWRSARQWRQISLDDDSDGANAIVDTLTGPEALEPYALSVRTESHDMLHEALARLPAAQRDAFLLHVEGGLSIAEIARVAGAPDETVKSRLRYAYARLRQSLEAAR